MKVPSVNDPLARRYCFRATCKLVDIGSKHKHTVGSFTGYDYRPTVARDVQLACKLHAGSLPIGHECTEVELVAFEECPMELTNDIYFKFENDK